MFERNGEALGSVLHSAAPSAPAHKRKPGRPKREDAVVRAPLAVQGEKVDNDNPSEPVEDVVVQPPAVAAKADTGFDADAFLSDLKDTGA